MPLLPSSRRLKLAGVTIASTAAAVTLVALPAQAAPVVRDGSSAIAAAASCYEIKQVAPAAPSGVYWLQTPALVAPQQFYCDQTTAGGGWELIGRGREGWDFLESGQGEPAAIASTPQGTAAFTPAYLPATTVDALLNGGRPDALPDGVRLVRALNTAGSAAQEVRFKFTSRDRWNWTIPASHPISSWSMTGAGTVSGGATTTANFGTDQLYNRVGTVAAKPESFNGGWDFGTAAPGSTAATSYIWKSTTSGARAIPFSQVWIRPTLLSSQLSYPAIGAGGTAATAQRAMPDTHVLTNPWGVGGLANGIDSVDDTEVRAIAQVGDRMIVGGNFAYVQQDANGTGRVNQSYLAAFDVNTGEWLPDFRPILNGQVQKLVALPNGDIVVGGDFSSVNGVAAPALTALDPTTGAIATNWSVHLEQHLASQPLYVRGLDVANGWLYVGGNFTHVSGGGKTALVYSRALARVSVATGQPDSTWHPVVLGNVNVVKASADGTRVYVGGRFQTIQGDNTKQYFATLSTAAGAAVVPGLAPAQFSNAKSKYVQAIAETPGRVWQGGAEHMLFTYDPSNLSLLSTNIAFNKGDFQILTPQNGVVYGSCHCAQWLLSGARAWPTATGWSEADSLEYVGAWDAATGKYISTFVPDGVVSRGEYGAWAITFDSNGTMWVGGDFVSARSSAAGAPRVWTGAFMRFPKNDSTPPPTPTGFTSVVKNGTTLRFTWDAQTDESGKPVSYELLQDDRVIGTVNGAAIEIPLPTDAHTYYVRTVDKAGNRSASTAALSYTP